MCGICGEIVFTGHEASTRAVKAMMAKMTARGPDTSGCLLQGGVVFGHRRLKIIDLSEKARQPMVDSHLGIDIVFNGCIYNYQELRHELTERGYNFFSSGDTEVIIKAFHAWGSACVEKFNGMFAFAIHERHSGRTVLARDRLGIKPLYLASNTKKLRFASSLPALLAAGEVDTDLDPAALHHYLHWHAVVPPPLTILKGVRKLPPATFRIYEKDGSFSDTVYWKLQLRQDSDDLKRSEEEWMDMVLDSLRHAVRRRMVADVPVGVLLSGGVDSSLLVGLLAEEGQKNLNTFSVGFEEAGGEKGDEFYYSDIIAEHFQNVTGKRLGNGARHVRVDECIRADHQRPGRQHGHDHVGVILLWFQIEAKRQRQFEGFVHCSATARVHPARDTAKSQAAGAIQHHRPGQFGNQIPA